VCHQKEDKNELTRVDQKGTFGPHETQRFNEPFDAVQTRESDQTKQPQVFDGSECVAHAVGILPRYYTEKVHPELRDDGEAVFFAPACVHFAERAEIVDEAPVLPALGVNNPARCEKIHDEVGDEDEVDAHVQQREIG